MLPDSPSAGDLRVVSDSELPIGSVVYFIRARLNGMIKIGTSNGVFGRLQGLRAAGPSPLDVVGLIDGGIELEHRIHAAFADCRAHGEWFRPSRHLLRAIEVVDDRAAFLEFVANRLLDPEVQSAQKTAAKVSPRIISPMAIARAMGKHLGRPRLSIHRDDVKWLLGLPKIELAFMVWRIADPLQDLGLWLKLNKLARAGVFDELIATNDQLSLFGARARVAAPGAEA